MQDSFKHPDEKLTIIGAGIIGAIEAYFAYKEAQANGHKIRITMLEKNATIAETTACRVSPSLTPDEIMTVVPPAPEFIEKLNILFSNEGGIRVNDVPGVNDSLVAQHFIQQVQEYNKDPAAQQARTDALFKMGKISMDLWQKIYDEADLELKQILDESNFQSCHEPLKANTVLHDGYRIDLIYNVANAAAKAEAMQKDYAQLGYSKCKILTPLEVMQLDPSLTNFCNNYTEISLAGARAWKKDTVALFRPGGCLDAEVFLPKFYAYLERVMGKYQNAAGALKPCFKLKFNREVNGVIFSDSPDHLSVSALKYGNIIKADKHKYATSNYVFCPGEAVNTLKKLRFAQPADVGFAGASLKLNIRIPADQLYQYQKINHCMEVYRGSVVLAWQVREIDGNIKISVAGTKAFYADQKPHKDQDFAKNRNLLQLNIINEVLPHLIEMAFKSIGLEYVTGRQLTAKDLAMLEQSGIARRNVGTRAVTADGFPTLGPLYAYGRLVTNARTTTHLGSGGGAFATGAVKSSRGQMKHLELESPAARELQKVIAIFSASNRRAKL